MQGRLSFTKLPVVAFANDGLPCVCIVAPAAVWTSFAFPAKLTIVLIDFSAW